MKKFFLLLCVGFLFTTCGTSTKTAQSQSVNSEIIANEISNPAKYASSITSDELREMLYKYASDEFEGRETGEKGQKLAVEYLKAQYQEMKIPSPCKGDDYFQEVPLEKQKVGEANLTVNGKEFENFDDMVALSVSESMIESINEIIYVGYGIHADNYSDYEKIDVKGKVVLAKAGEPKDADGNYITSGTKENTKWTNGRQSLSSKRDAAIENGAKGLLYLDDNLFSRYSRYFKRQSESRTAGRLALKSEENGMYMIMISENVASAILPDIENNSTPKALQSNIKLNVTNNSLSVDSENVVAFIEGSEKPNEILVISAHLDHEGVKDDKVYNGADDDGSGTVAILEIAEAFKIAKDAGKGPKRSILFLHVTGEEKGLLGSRYYTDINPIFPLENTVVNLNIDMIGRTDPKRKEGSRNYVYLIGSDKLSTDLHNLSEAVNKKYANIELDYTYNDENDPNRYYYRSDHYNFAKNNIPVIFYFNGTHDDYHQPSDTPDKIEYDLLENRTRLVFYTAWEIANRDERIVVDKVTRP
ncbi:M28 family peptidase [Winogradskyella alexanderae]|uniref:M28 family peptidase n=1 Tax=Winogradskyella alexanderae TaxID=2877123 RepID=A0ABS7XSD3_9FLAO|nr:M28 family peptidase [Winogradskyella alexanderae]MCA0131842.1 M28 family peptidase [Winogradskyella alexanderae]